MASYFRSAITGSTGSRKKASGGMEKAATEVPVDDAAAATVAVTASEGVSVCCTGDGVEKSSAAQHDRIEDEAEPFAPGDNKAQTSGCLSVCGTDPGNASCSSTHNKLPNELHKVLEDSLADTRNYEVTYEHAPDDDDDDDNDEGDHNTCAGRCHHHHHDSNSNSDDTSTSAACDKKLRLQFIDVLLQADSHGLGLNIQVVERNSVVTCSGGASLIVASFRRLHPRDVGPAEATRQIQQGDLLYSVDGEVMRDLQHLHSTLQHKRIGSSHDGDAPFVLLRFLRHVSLVNESDSASTSSLTTEEEEEQQIEPKRSDRSISASPRKRDVPHDAFEHWLENKHQVAILVRELATKNQKLQEELVSSKLKLAEQSIQLEQLYVLYAKTQLDNSPAFAISKSLRPFARRSSVSVASEKYGMSSPLGVVRKSTASSTKLHCEIEFAVQAEQERLRKHYQLQADIEKRQVAACHQQELQTLKETMEKKLSMLEVGYREALKQQQEARASNSIETCSCGTWMRLQQELYIHQSLDHDGEQESAECLVCNLLTDAKWTSTCSPNDRIKDESSSSTSRKMQRVLDVLHEYDLLKQKRTQSLDDTAGKPTQRVRDDLLQP